jgi:tetratricopeptide (TPR) repeat protein
VKRKNQYNIHLIPRSRILYIEQNIYLLRDNTQLTMFNETISFLSSVDINFLDALFSVIGGVIVLITVFFGIIRYVRPNKEFSDLFIYSKAKNLQQQDLGIQQPLGANIEEYWRRDSDEEIEKSLKAHENVLIIGRPKMGKTRSVYQALKAALPDFYVIRVPPRKVEDFRLPFLKKNYLVFFDDLNEFIKVKFDFEAFLKKFAKKSKLLVIVSTLRSGDEYNDVKKNSMQTLRDFPNEVNLDDYVMDKRDGEALAVKAGVPWRPEQFLGTPGSVVLDIEDMKNRYRSASDHEKCILRSCKLLKRANIFVYKKELIRAICGAVFEIPLTEDSWIEAINHLSENSLVTKASIPRIDVYDPTLEMVVYDYDPVYHLESLLTLLTGLKDVENLFYLGNAFYYDKNYDKAEKSYSECLSINPDDAKAHYNLGLLLQELGRNEEAEREYREAIRSNPDLAEAHSNLGVLLKELERKEEAETEYKEAIRSDPDYAEAHGNLGILYSETERVEEAKKELELAKRLFDEQGRAEDVKKTEELLKSL